MLVAIFARDLSPSIAKGSAMKKHENVILADIAGATSTSVPLEDAARTLKLSKAEISELESSVSRQRAMDAREEAKAKLVVRLLRLCE